ncbi:MAG: hypothetical protein QNJ94_01905 [Alphaproteobacteria bacterium]|nr:hypothetical protein [Alphaproteobacteria bacterium]
MAEDFGSAPKFGRVDDRLLAHVAYGLFALVIAVPNPFTPLAGVVVAYLKVGTAADPLGSHFRWLIRTFWLCLAAAAIALLLMVTEIGLALLLAVAVWYVYRIVKGWLRLNDGRPIADPTALF